MRHTLQEIKDIYEEIDELDLPDGAHWAMVGERLGMEGYEVMEIMADNPKFFGIIPEVNEG